nr:class I SAM-dependent methyltransferase [Candidatus Woesearchaeota archaeon]
MIIDDLKDIERRSIYRRIPILGRVKGEWLLNAINKIKPKMILELGTANGYSGIILGSTGAKLTTIDVDEKLSLEAKENFQEFNVKADVVVGDAVDIVSKLAKKKENYGIFDLIFIDFEKRRYIDVLEDCLKLLKNHGYIIADNITFDAVKDFKDIVLKHPRLETDIIEVGDGLSLSKKTY